MGRNDEDLGSRRALLVEGTSLFLSSFDIDVEVHSAAWARDQGLLMVSSTTPAHFPICLHSAPRLTHSSQKLLPEAMTDAMLRTLIDAVEFLVPSLHEALKWDPIEFGPIIPVRAAPQCTIPASPYSTPSHLLESYRASCLIEYPAGVLHRRGGNRHNADRASTTERCCLADEFWQGGRSPAAQAFSSDTSYCVGCAIA